MGVGFGVAPRAFGVGFGWANNESSSCTPTCSPTCSGWACRSAAWASGPAHLTGGRWGHRLKRILEAGMLTLPLCSLFIPIWIDLDILYRGRSRTDGERSGPP
jgi:hypothetical protein